MCAKVHEKGREEKYDMEDSRWQQQKIIKTALQLQTNEYKSRQHDTVSTPTEKLISRYFDSSNST